jgi:hypothetical protein
MLHGLFAASGRVHWNCERYDRSIACLDAIVGNIDFVDSDELGTSVEINRNSQVRIKLRV